MKICCGSCGSWYGSKIWHSTDKYRRVVWRCNGKYERQTGCKTPRLSETQIKTLFLRALSKLREQRETFIADCEALKGMLSDTSEIDGERARIAAEQSETETLAGANAMTAMNQSEFNRRYEEYVKKHDALSERLDKLDGKLEKRKQEIVVLNRFISDLTAMKELPVEFSGELWNALVEKLTIYPDGRAEFLFKNGAAITESI